MKLSRVALWLVVLTLLVLLLYFAQNLLIPVVIAFCIAYMINGIAKLLARLKIGSFSIPHKFCVGTASVILVVIIFVAIEVIIQQVDTMVETAPMYQENFEARLGDLLGLLGINELPDFASILHDVDLRSLIQGVASTLSSMAGNLVLIIIYTIFILLEQNTFPRKWRALFATEEKYLQGHNTLNRINQSIREYISVKTAVSALTALCSFTLMTIMGLNFAIFWAFLIFLLNYIPNFGSLFATLFPIIFSLLQFESMTSIIILSVGVASIQITMGNFVEPRMMGRTLNMSALVVLIALAVWGAIWGITGMILSVPIMMIVMIVLAEFPETRPISVLLSADGSISEQWMGEEELTEEARGGTEALGGTV